MQPDSRDGLASIREATEYLSISRSALYGLMNRAELKYAKIGKCRRIPWSALRELAQRSLVEARS